MTSPAIMQIKVKSMHPGIEARQQYDHHRHRILPNTHQLKVVFYQPHHRLTVLKISTKMRVVPEVVLLAPEDPVGQTVGKALQALSVLGIKIYMLVVLVVILVVPHQILLRRIFHVSVTPLVEHLIKMADVAQIARHHHKLTVHLFLEAIRFVVITPLDMPSINF